MRVGSFALGWCLVLSAAAQGALSTAEKLDPNMAVPAPDGQTLWYDALSIGLEAQGFTELKHPYDRLPAKGEGVVPEAVWKLSQHSAGLCVRFVTESPGVSARWTLRSENLAMPHMPATGVSGLDLYTRDTENRWRFIGNGRPSGLTNEAKLSDGAPEGPHEYLLYLPLYNGIDKLEIGIAPGASLAKGPAYPEDRAKPVVVYGTSIVHGGCASRPGMAHTAIMGRMLDRPVVNLGFSGNGKMELEMADRLAEIDAAVYVLDCAPNMTPELIAERYVPFVHRLRETRPETPIVFVENIVYQRAWFSVDGPASYESKNAAVKAAYDALAGENMAELSYVPCTALLGDDSDATVDGTHPTDLGFLRMAEAIAPVVREALAH
jgi:hypothetical protein